MKSQQRPWALKIFKLASGVTVPHDLDGCVYPYAWSPDGSALAVMVTPCNQKRTMLCVVSIPQGRVTWLDTLRVFSDYEFSWSPDSRVLAVMRPTSIDETTEDLRRAEIWLIARTGMYKQAVAADSTYIPHNPRWVDRSHVAFERLCVKGASRGREDRVVIGLEERRNP